MVSFSHVGGSIPSLATPQPYPPKFLTFPDYTPSRVSALTGLAGEKGRRLVSS